jgi:hypothetical protein
LQVAPPESKRALSPHRESYASLGPIQDTAKRRIRATKTYLYEIYEAWVIVYVKNVLENLGTWFPDLVVIILEQIRQVLAVEELCLSLTLRQDIRRRDT